MNWYEVRKRDNTNPDPFVADGWDLRGLDETDFLQGKRIDNWPDDVSFRATTPENDGAPDDALANELLLPIVSKRVQQALAKAKIGDIQFLPVHVFDSRGRRVKGYSILNILRLIDALDMERSKVDYFPDDWPVEADRGKFWVCEKAVLVSSKLASVDIFRLQIDPFLMFASEKFSSIFEKNKFTGIGFLRVRTNS